MLNREEFYEEVKDRVLDQLADEGKEIDGEIAETTKNNGVVLHGLQFRGASQVQPIVYLDCYYGDYEKGESVEEIADRVVDIYHSSEPAEGFEIKSLTDYNQAKDHIFPCVRNAETNTDMLKNVPHDMVEDLAITYRIQVDSFQGSVGSVLINKGLFESFGVSQDTLREQAWKNTREQQPYKLENMLSVIREMMGDFGDNQEAEDLMDNFEEVDENPMYVLTNQSKFNGAVYLCDKETLQKVAEQLDDNLAIIPSSIHETIILPEKKMGDYQRLKEMVEEVNNTQVSPEERLSDNVYRYDKDAQTLSVYTGPKQEMSMNM